MGDFIEIARTGDLAVGMMKKVCVGSHELLLARTAGDFYCADNRCPHLNGDLSRGTLAGKVITCPDHFSQFRPGQRRGAPLDEPDGDCRAHGPASPSFETARRL